MISTRKTWEQWASGPRHLGKGIDGDPYSHPSPVFKPVMFAPLLASTNGLIPHATGAKLNVQLVVTVGTGSEVINVAKADELSSNRMDTCFTASPSVLLVPQAGYEPELWPHLVR